MTNAIGSPTEHGQIKCINEENGQIGQDKTVCSEEIEWNINKTNEAELSTR